MPDKDEPKADGTHTNASTAEVKTSTPKAEDNTRETVDPAERLPEDPDAQNDLA